MTPDRVTQKPLKLPPILLAVVLFSGTLSYLAWASDLDPEYGGTYVTASIAEPNNLIPVLATDAPSQDIVGRVFNGLLRYNPEIELEGDLAKSWEVLNGGETIIFHLREGVLWHDGQPFTAEDVEFTYQKLVDPTTPSPYGGDFERIEKLTVLNPYTVKVKYKEPFSPGLASWTMWIMPKHLLEKEDLLITDFARNPVGTGPYRFKRWLTGDRVELVVSENYYEGRAKIDRVIYRIIPDQTTMFLELHQEAIDSMGLTPLQYQRQTSTSFFETNFQRFRYPSFGYTYLGLNLKDPFFKDVRVRRAINHAIDRQEIIDAVLLGLGQVITGPFSPESWAYNPDVKPFSYDPEEAKRLLQESGFQDHNGDGILEKDDKKFSFTIVTNQGNFQRQQACEIIQRRLREVGIEVRIKVLEWSAFLNEVVHKRKFEAIVLGWGLNREPDPFDIWHSSKVGEGEFNFIYYKNERVDELIEQGRRVFDIEERRKIYHEVHRLIHEDQPYIFLFEGDALPIVHRRFQNVQVTKIGLGYNFIHWEVPPDKRKYMRFKLEP